MPIDVLQEVFLKIAFISFAKFIASFFDTCSFSYKSSLFPTIARTIINKI
jgi:hypothetical protein